MQNNGGGDGREEKREEGTERREGERVCVSTLQPFSALSLNREADIHELSAMTSSGILFAHFTTIAAINRCLPGIQLRRNAMPGSLAPVNTAVIGLL